MATRDRRDLNPSEAALQASVARSPKQARAAELPTQARSGLESSAKAQARTPIAEPQLDLEDLAIDRAGEIPIGVQLAWALRARIGDGRLAPGRRLPGLRELAEMLGINANTARAVYQRLEQEGLIDSRQGTGTFVASIAPEPSAVGQIAADAARQAHRTGVDPREVAAALYVTPGPPTDVAMRQATDAQALAANASAQTADASTPGLDTVGHTATTSARAAERRRELRAQIAALEQTLSEMQARHPGLIPTPSKQLRHAGPRLLSVQELERVRTQLVRRLAAAQPLLETPAQSKQAAVRERQEPARATTRDADPMQVEPPAPVKKPARRRARTRPSTA
jgi:DNA-binding transcriptional regulator YhcF (GntR family)